MFQEEEGEFYTYHIIQRGNDRKEIFLSNYDKSRYIKTFGGVMAFDLTGGKPSGNLPLGFERSLITARVT